MGKRGLVLGGVILLVVLGGMIGVSIGPNPGDGAKKITDSEQSMPLNSQPPVVEGREFTASNSKFAWIYFALAIMAFATLTSISITFYLYRWRRILLSRPGLIVPEEWGKYLENVGKSASKLSDNMRQGMHDLSEVTSDGIRKINSMVDTFMALQSVLDEKDAEIRRLRSNYDAEIFRRFILRFIRVDQTISDFIQLEMHSKESLLQIKRLLEDALDECGIECFSPNIGEDYRVAEGVSDNPKKIKAQNPEDEFRIASVVQEGYRLRNPGGFETISPAKVKIYALE